MAHAAKRSSKKKARARNAAMVGAMRELDTRKTWTTCRTTKSQLTKPSRVRDTDGHATKLSGPSLGMGG